MAAATRRSRPMPSGVVRSAAPSISFPDATSAAISASKIRRPPTTRSTIIPIKAKGLPISPQSSIPPRGSSIWVVSPTVASRFRTISARRLSSRPLASDFNSANLNENQREFNSFNVLALQYSSNGLDLQTSYFNRYSSVHFVPDVVGDLVFNGVASDVYRRSFTNGVQTDAAYRLSNAHTLHAGFTFSAENAFVSNGSVLLPVDNTGTPVDAPFNVLDQSSKTGFLFGTYIGDEWKMTNQLTLNYGLRFDEMMQYTNANQVSPRISLTYTPWDGTVFHAGYARYFTPPQLVLAAPTNLALVQNTTQQPEVNLAAQVLPERSHYFDVGVTQKLLPGLELGVDGYYKIAKDLLDDGQFGAAYVLTGFNYEKGDNYGVELSAKYTDTHFRAYANIAYARQIATNVVSNQFLFGADEIAYIASH